MTTNPLKLTTIAVLAVFCTQFSLVAGGIDRSAQGWVNRVARFHGLDNC